jgi:hypothetical protein
MVKFRRGGRLRSGASLIAVLLAVLLLVGRASRSAEPAADDNQRATRTADENSGDADGPVPQARTPALSLAFILLACIIAGGALLLTLVVTWGNRARRLARSPLPPVSERDELWFLKHKKPLPERESETQNEARSDPPGRE